MHYVMYVFESDNSISSIFHQDILNMEHVLLANHEYYQ